MSKRKHRSLNAPKGSARLHAAFLCVSALCWLQPACAEISDTIHPFLSTSILYEDNLLRLADNAPTPPQGRSDIIKKVEGGLLFERPIGRQVLSGQAKLTKAMFTRYSELDYTGKDLLALWNWRLANHLEGHVGSSYSQVLAPYNDFHTNQRNLRIQRRQYVDGTWRFHPSWQMRGGYSRDSFTYDLAAQRFNNRVEQAGEIGWDYLASSGSKVGVLFRRLDAVYPDHRTSGFTTIDDGYTQNEAKANINWILSGITQIQFLGGWVQRKHTVFTGRDDSGVNARLVTNWSPRRKIQFVLAWWREFTAVESTSFSSSLNNGASIGAKWDATSKLRFDTQFKREKRDFSSSGLAATGLNDLTRSATLGVTYTPVRNVQVALTTFRELHSESPGVGLGSYRAGGASFTLSGQF
jgi:exopolysaccharide biosynthesis operon protein EpsL